MQTAADLQACRILICSILAVSGLPNTFTIPFSGKLVNQQLRRDRIFSLMLKKDKLIREICTLEREKKLCYDLVTKRKNLRKFLLFEDTDLGENPLAEQMEQSVI